MLKIFSLCRLEDFLYLVIRIYSLYLLWYLFLLFHLFNDSTQNQVCVGVKEWISSILASINVETPLTTLSALDSNHFCWADSAFQGQRCNQYSTERISILGSKKMWVGPPHPTLIWSQPGLEPATLQRSLAYEAEATLTHLQHCQPTTLFLQGCHLHTLLHCYTSDNGK